MKNKIAIVGAGGFVGSRIVEHAVLHGDASIVPVVRSLAGVARLARFGVECRIADANSEESIAKAVGDCDRVVNLTAGDSRRLVSQLRNVYAACERHSVRVLVHLSSAVVFGPDADPAISDKAAPVGDQQNQYAREKARAEQFLASRGRSITEVVTLRPGLVWGPHSPWVTDPLKALSNGTAYYANGGSGICNLIYVDNLVESILAVARHPHPRDGFYNVSDDRRYTWRDYYAALAPLVGRTIADVTDVGDVVFQPNINSRIQGLKETWWFDILKRRLTGQTKLRMKEAMQDLLSRGRAEAASTPTVAVTREMLTLQRTSYVLPIDAFRASFGSHNVVSFETALERTLTWAAFAGFVSPVQTASPQLASLSLSAPGN